MGLIPLNLYNPLYYHIIFVFVVLVFIHAQSSFDNYRYIAFNRLGFLLLFAFLLLYMGLRPVGYTFGDMGTYAKVYEGYQLGIDLTDSRDYGFDFFMYQSAQLISKETFFFVCSVLYILPLVLFSIRMFSNFSFLGLLFFAGSFSFWAYGTNGIRAGIAGSLFFLALYFWNQRALMWVTLLLSISFHKSMLLPCLAFAATFFNNNFRHYLIAWVASIFLSIALGGFWESFFAGLGLGDDRFSSYLLTDEYVGQFSRSGFRWDFVLYSFSAIGAAAHYILKHNFRDKFYLQVVNTYLLSNAFWVLVIRASFSNRFAYLSWFMMAFVIIYPLLKKRMWGNQYQNIATILVLYFSFTYLLNVILA